MTVPTQGDPLIFGHDEAEGIVGLERVPGDNGSEEMLLYVRRGKKIEELRQPFSSFVWLEKPELLSSCKVPVEFRKLRGKGVLNCMAVLECSKDLEIAVKHLKRKTGTSPSAPEAPYFFLNDPVQQYLILAGRTSFKGMKFGELKRMQLDIETYTAEGFEFPNADRENDRIIAIALADETGWTEVLSGKESDEKQLLESLVAVVRERDPDVIEGHNIFKFDFPYLLARARRCGIKLALGRDGSVPRVRSGRFSVAERSVTYPKVAVFGRHVVDTLFLVQIYDVSHRSLEGFGLKEVACHFGISAKDRTYVEGGEINETFDRDPDRLMAYARDDILETRALSDLLSPIYFAQAQILPFSYQNVCVRGNAAKIDALMLREYLRESHAIPRPDQAREFAGGYTDIFFEGVAKNVHHCDIRSLYPSLMLKHKLAPATDELEVFLRLLEYLRGQRLGIKSRLTRSSVPDEQVYLGALDATFKVLINSFYGYLGFGQGRFSDFSQAERVAAEGRDLLKKMIDWIGKRGGKPIEIDTDGIYFVPPPFKKPSDVEEFRADFRRSLPAGIEIEFDGEYCSMFSYKMKNYALLAEDGEMIIKGAALKSRGLEAFQREFLREVLRLKLEQREQDIPDLKARYAEAIRSRSWPIRMLAKTERLQEAPGTYAAKIKDKARGRNAAYELALASERDYQAGDPLSYYVTGSKKSVPVHSHAKLVSEWDPENRDENILYYLAKLDALCRKFEVEQQTLDL